MTKLGKTAQIYSDKSLRRAMKAILENYSTYLSDDDKAIFDNFENVIQQQDNKIKEVLSGLKTVRTCDISIGRRDKLSINTRPLFGSRDLKQDDGTYKKDYYLEFGTDHFNGLPVFVTENGRGSDIHSTYLPKLLKDGKFDKCSYIVLEKHDLLPWIKNFDVGKVTNISKMLDAYKTELAEQRKAARAGRVPVEYSKRPVFHIGECSKYGHLYTFEDVEKKAAEENKTVIYSVVKSGWNENYSISLITKPTTKEEERNFKVSEISYVCKPIENIMDDLQMDKSEYMFVSIEAANYKALKLWNCKTWIAVDDFVKTEVKAVLENFHQVNIRRIKGGMFDGMTREQASDALEFINKETSDDQKAMPFYTALTKNLAELASDSDYTSDEVYKLVSGNRYVREIYQILKMESPIVRAEIDDTNSLDAYPMAKCFSYQSWNGISLKGCPEEVFGYFASMDRLAELEASKAE